MTETAQQLISAFKSLPVADQKEVLLNLLRMPLETPYFSATDDDLRFAADALFLEMDQRESRL